MQKYLISIIVIIGFVYYSFYERMFGTKAVVLVSPSNTKPKGVVQILPTKPINPTVNPTAAVSPTRVDIVTPTNVPTPTVQNTPTPTPGSGYKDGTYTGNAADAFYGLIQVQAIIANGRITSVQFLQAPNDRGTSIEINSQADPLLAQEAIQAQSAQVNIVSGATDSSQAFVQSLQSALDQAKS